MNEKNDVRLLTWFSGVIVFVLVVAVSKILSDLILPVFVSLLVARLLRPYVVKLTTFKIPYSLSVLLVTLGCFGILALSVSAVAFCGSQVASTIPTYLPRIEASLHDLQLQIHAISQQVGIADEASQPRNIISASTIVSVLSATIGSTLSILTNGVLIFILVLMLLASGDSFNKAILAAYGPEKHKRIIDVIHSVDAKVEQFLLSKSLVNLLSGAMVSIVLLIFGVDLALTFGVMTFFLTFVPAVGGLVALALPIGLAYLQFGSGGAFAGVVISLIVANTIIERALEPKIMGKSMDLSPVVVFLAFIFFSWMWGAVGALIAVPVTAMVKVFCESIPALSPVAILMREN